MPQRSQLTLPPLQQQGPQWFDAMLQAIARCAPTVVRVFARLDQALPQGMDRETLAGRIILQAARAACAEDWNAGELDARTEATAMECIANEFDGLRAPVELGLGGQGKLGSSPYLEGADPQRRMAVMRALDRLEGVRLQVLALILQEGLSIGEAALVLGLPEWRVHQECAQAVGQIRRQISGEDEPATTAPRIAAGPRWSVETAAAAGEAR
jgi:DNA-directed RNA polymerase specialized sigma24 family protein